MTCGTNSSYNRGCHCDACKSAHAERQRIYNRNYYERHRDKILAIKAKYDEVGRTKKRQPVKPPRPHDWMDKRAEEVWQKHKDRQPDYPMYRSPLRDLT